MRRATVLAVLACVVAVMAAGAFSGAKWQQKTANEKHADLWKAIASTPGAAPWPSTITLAGLFTESMDTSFDTMADEMPKQGFLGMFTRQKLIHSVGGIASCRFVPQSGSRYTGLFRGSDYMFIRLSTARKPDNSNIHSYTPGIAVKWLRNGVKSANLVAMYGLDGQPSFDFFAHDLSSHVPNLGPGAPVALKALKAKFETASHWPVMVGLSDIAKYKQDGSRESSPVFPYRLHFETMFRGSMKTQPDSHDLPTRLMSMSQLKAGSVLYKVHAAPEPNSPETPNKNLEYIGDIVLTGPFVASKWSDQTLFFEHQRMEDDLKLRPSWEHAAQAQIDYQGSHAGFHYPDLNP